MGVASSQRIKLGTQGSEGGCQCILRLGTPGTQTADDLGESVDGTGGIFIFKYRHRDLYRPRPRPSGRLLHGAGRNGVD